MQTFFEPDQFKKPKLTAVLKDDGNVLTKRHTSSLQKIQTWVFITKI